MYESLMAVSGSGINSRYMGVAENLFQALGNISEVKH